jgi:hypothetical protein
MIRYQGLRTLLLSCSVLLVSTVPASADVRMGGGYSCAGSSMTKAGKVVSYTKAKSNMTKTIAKLKAKLASAPSSKRAAIRAQLKTATHIKVLLNACRKGELSSSDIDPIFTQLASGTGTYTGPYTGVVGGILALKGSITVVFSLQGTVFKATMTLGGNLGTTVDAKPLSFEQDISGIGFPAQLLLRGTFLGDVTLSITQTGHLSLATSNFAKGQVSFEGDFTNNSITSTLGGSYNGVSFSGNATLIRQ